MQTTNKQWYAKGLRDGLPIALGYFAVAFTLGIAAKNAGLSALQAAVVSFTNSASAGQYAGFTVMAAGGTLLEMAVMMLVVNARYFLMSCALSQKLSPKTPLWQRLIMGYAVTDELFGIGIAVPGTLCPYYFMGGMTVAVPGWTAGTYLGVVMGNVLPANIVSALSVALYGMFIFVIVPPAKKNKVILGLVALSMAVSAAVAFTPYLRDISEGTRTILLTVLLAGLAAAIFPVKEEEASDDEA